MAILRLFIARPKSGVILALSSVSTLMKYRQIIRHANFLINARSYSSNGNKLLHSVRVHSSGNGMLNNGRTFASGSGRSIFYRSLSDVSISNESIPSKCDVLIVGGGAMGSSIAYHLKREAKDDISVVVVEADNTYKTSSTTLSMGCIRQQFTVLENIHLSLFGRKFLKGAHRWLRVPGQDPPEVQFRPSGFLVLASDVGERQLLQNYQLQRAAGAKLELLTSSQLKRKYPWMKTNDIAVAVLGVENEGWFDPWTLLMGFRSKAVSLGAKYVHGKVTAIEDKNNDPARILDTVNVTTSKGEHCSIQFSTIVIAAGMRSGRVSKLAGIGMGVGQLATPLPVEPRKRYVYCAHVPKGPVGDCPILCDPTGAHFRPDATPNLFLCIRNPNADEEPDTDDLEVDHSYFEERIWPSLAKRIPAFEHLKVRSSWAGFYDYNTLDQNAVLGRHPFYNNLIFATGFSGHGIQHSPGIGQCMMEYILYGGYRTINLSRLGFERIIANEPLVEKNVF